MGFSTFHWPMGIISPCKPPRFTHDKIRPIFRKGKHRGQPLYELVNDLFRGVVNPAAAWHQIWVILTWGTSRTPCLLEEFDGYFNFEHGISNAERSRRSRRQHMDTNLAPSPQILNIPDLKVLEIVTYLLNFVDMDVGQNGRPRGPQMLV